MRRITLSQYRRKAARRKIKAYNHNACVFPMSVCARAIKCAGADHSVACNHNGVNDKKGLPLLSMSFRA